MPAQKVREPGQELAEDRERGRRGLGDKESNEKWEGVPFVEYHEFFTEVIYFQWKE